MANDRDSLLVIIGYCDRIADAVSQYGDDLEGFVSNVHYSQSCAFSLLQIGEAVKRLSPELVCSNPNVQWNQIARFRDLIAHQYGHLDMSMVWESVIKEVPELRSECDRILRSLS